MTCFWLSWADEEGFNGVCIVEANSFEEAVTLVNIKNVRPSKGGQLVAFEIESSQIDSNDFNRLLSREEAKKYT